MIDQSQEIDENSPGEFSNVRVNTTIVARPKLTFFYKKNNGEIFAAEEQESANGKYGRKFNFVGWSDGTTYQRVIKNVSFKRGELIPKEKAEALLKEAFDAELAVAENNLKEARELNKPVPVPRRVEWAFDSSVPEHERFNISKGTYKGI